MDNKNKSDCMVLHDTRLAGEIYSIIIFYYNRS